MIDQITSCRRPNPVSGLMARAVTPAAMTALIEAQERLSQDAPAFERQQTAAQIDQLMYELNEAPQGAYGRGPMTVRQLRVSRYALSQSLIDLQA